MRYDKLNYWIKKKEQEISQQFTLAFFKMIQFKLFDLKSSKLTNLSPYMVYCHQVKFKVLYQIAITIWAIKSIAKQ